MELAISKTLSIRLRDKNLSALAKELEIPKSMLHDWVKGNRVPSLNNIDHLEKLAHYLDLSLEELLTGVKEEKTIISSILFQDDSRQYKISVERLK